MLYLTTCAIIDYLTQQCTLKSWGLIQYLGQQCVFKIQYLDQQRVILTKYLLIKKSIAPVRNIKAWGRDIVIHSTGNYGGDVLEIYPEVEQSGTQ